MTEPLLHLKMRILAHPTRAVTGVNVQKPRPTTIIATVLLDIMAQTVRTPFQQVLSHENILVLRIVCDPFGIVIVFPVLC